MKYARYCTLCVRAAQRYESHGYKIKFFVIINADSPLLADEETANIEKIVISSRWISFESKLSYPRLTC